MKLTQSVSPILELGEIRRRGSIIWTYLLEALLVFLEQGIGVWIPLWKQQI
jgi:hypothetical protein